MSLLPDSGLCLVLLLAYGGDRFHPDVGLLQIWRESLVTLAARGHVMLRALLAVQEWTGPLLLRVLRAQPWLARALRRLVLAPLARGIRRRVQRVGATGASREQLAIDGAPPGGCGCTGRR